MVKLPAPLARHSRNRPRCRPSQAIPPFDEAQAVRPGLPTAATAARSCLIGQFPKRGEARRVPGRLRYRGRAEVTRFLKPTFVPPTLG